MPLTDASNILWSLLLLITGAITCFFDITRQKILNTHLVFLGMLGAIVLLFHSLLWHHDPATHMLNGAIALVVGAVLYISHTWRGGDAKLFTLYAFLMPLPAKSNLFSLPPVALFINTFLAGMFFLAPFLIKDMIHNRAAVIAQARSAEEQQAFLRGISAAFFASWILSPVMQTVVKAYHTPLSFFIAYVVFAITRNAAIKTRTDYIQHNIQKHLLMIVALLVTGTLLRIFLTPWALNPFYLAQYAVIFLAFSVSFAVIFHTIQHLENHKERIAFAPFLFIGCVLSYTPFLSLFMRALHH